MTKATLFILSAAAMARGGFAAALILLATLLPLCHSKGGARGIGGSRVFGRGIGVGAGPAPEGGYPTWQYVAVGALFVGCCVCGLVGSACYRDE